MVLSGWYKVTAIGQSILIALCLLYAGCSVEKHNPHLNQIDIVLPPIEQQWGVQVEGIRLSAAGYMLDFRYRVLQPDKAVSIFNRSKKPYLIHHTSGAKLQVPVPPKVGPLRQTTIKPKTGRTYFVIFANPGRLVNKGDKVTVVIDDFKAENLIVR